jgi:hypothetical protein
MKSNHIILYIIVAVSVMTATCNKYEAFTGTKSITGYAYLTDGVSNAAPVALANQKIALNVGADTSNYQYEVKTDEAGYFAFNGLSEKENYVVFTRYTKGGVEYAGAVKVAKTQIENTGAKITLNVSPVYGNGMFILFADTLNGALPNLPFRVYTSRLAASVDSVKYASHDTVTNAEGNFSLYNIKPVKYYFVARDTIAGIGYKVFDSTTVPATGIIKDTVYLKR